MPVYLRGVHLPAHLPSGTHMTGGDTTSRDERYATTIVYRRLCACAGVQSCAQYAV